MGFQLEGGEKMNLHNVKRLFCEGGGEERSPLSNASSCDSKKTRVNDQKDNDKCSDE